MRECKSRWDKELEKKYIMQETALTSGPNTQTGWIRDAYRATGPNVVLKYKA